MANLILARFSPLLLPGQLQELFRALQSWDRAGAGHSSRPSLPVTPHKDIFDPLHFLTWAYFTCPGLPVLLWKE